MMKMTLGERSGKLLRLAKTAANTARSPLVVPTNTSLGKRSMRWRKPPSRRIALTRTRSWPLGSRRRFDRSGLGIIA